MREVYLNLNSYNLIFLDFDGVICDSNSLKEMNIYNATKKFFNDKTAKEFTEYFTSNNGIPRELKVLNYFGNNIISQKILKEYEKLNKNLISARLNVGLKNFLTSFNNKKLILSGGDKKEIENYLITKKIYKYFDRILCGPLSKIQNIEMIELQRPALFIGDSRYDYEVTKYFEIDFLFMYGKTQYQNFDDELRNVFFTKNFRTLIEGKIYEKN